MIRSNLFDYSDACLRVKATITVPNTAAAVAPLNNSNKKAIFKNCIPIINGVSRIDNEQLDNPQDIDIVMGMYNFIEYSDVYQKTSVSLWQYFRDEAALDNNNNIIDFPAKNNNSISFKYKQQITEQARNGGKKNVKLMVPYLVLLGEFVNAIN